MSNKEQFLEFLNETSSVVFDKFHTAFGYDDWCDALIDFPEAQEVYLKKQNIVDEIVDWKTDRDSDEKRNEILNAFQVFLRENEGKEEKDYTRTEIGYVLAQKL